MTARCQLNATLRNLDWRLDLCTGAQLLRAARHVRPFSLHNALRIGPTHSSVPAGCVSNSCWCCFFPTVTQLSAASFDTLLAYRGLSVRTHACCTTHHEALRTRHDRGRNRTGVNFTYVLDIESWWFILMTSYSTKDPWGFWLDRAASRRHVVDIIQRSVRDVITRL